MPKGGGTGSHARPPVGEDAGAWHYRRMSPSTDSATERAVQRAAVDYDQTPYHSVPFPMTRPAHVAAVLHLFGLAAPDVESARVLEIGCSGGGNLVPLAAAFPQARFVGIDISAVQIRRASEQAAAVGLSNIEFRQASITEIDESWGAFDYIICHGVYSYVPAEVRRAILRVSAERLTASGAAVVSYNVLPGWHLRRVTRDAMLEHAALFDTPAEKIAEARKFLDFLKDHAPDDDYGQVLRQEAASMPEQRDDYVMHEFLEPENSACSVLEFVHAAEGAGLGYLADAVIHEMFPESHGAEMAATLRQFSPDDPLKLERYLDLVIGRTFRQSILMKPAALARAQRALGPSSMAGLHVAARFAEVPSLDGPGPFVFKARARSEEAVWSLTIGSPAAARALAMLSHRWPASATTAELIDAAASDGTPRETVAALVLDLLFRLMAGGMLVLSAAPIRAGGADASHPVGWPVARADARRGAGETANLLHMSAALDGPSRTLLPLLDGTRDRPALIEHLAGKVADGSIALQHDGKPIQDPEIVRRAVAGLVESTLRTLAAAALLSA
jgi:trans-aconitate methyltransferase